MGGRHALDKSLPLPVESTGSQRQRQEIQATTLPSPLPTLDVIRHEVNADPSTARSCRM
jgi:hypothetical protein